MGLAYLLLPRHLNPRDLRNLEINPQALSSTVTSLESALGLRVSKPYTLYPVLCRSRGIGVCSTRAKQLPYIDLQVYSWVNTEVCLEEDVSRRSFVVQKFIKIATQ